jgi:hypothetical protein
MTNRYLRRQAAIAQTGQQKLYSGGIFNDGDALFDGDPDVPDVPVGRS